MKPKILRLFAFIITTGALAVVLVLPAGSAAAQSGEDPVARGEYLAAVSGCKSCHTPFQDEYNNPETLTLDQIKTLSMHEEDAQDFENRLLAGGRVFPLGPAGIVISANITPDIETGIGSWTDEQIETAIRTGMRPDGRVLFPLMPYGVYRTMSDADMTAIITYLRSVPPVSNAISKEGQVSTEGMPPLPAATDISEPDRSDPVAYGGYLVSSLLACTDCHTPTDPTTGAPIFEKYLGGGQPFEGPWGIVYGGNITPDEATGLGTWSAAEIKRVFASGVRPDGRRLIVMPWQGYSRLNPDDMDAVVAYLQEGLAPISNEVPATSVSPEIAEFVEIPAEPEGGGMSRMVIAGIIIALLVLIFFIVRMRKPKASPSE
jgi:mono/diheme cytochrome c family protein